ncbi:MAG: helix-turn-helix domain-containing protein [bacterium]|nr:helix-turn-helix domain-containing protein [bacterium]
MRDPILVDAIDKAGGPTAFGRSQGIGKSAVIQWQRCPPHRCLALEEASGVSRHKLRPDIYGKASRKKAGNNA